MSSINPKFVQLEQPLINSIPAQFVERFDPIFVEYYNRYYAGRINAMAPHQLHYQKLRTEPQNHLVLFGRDIVPAVERTTDHKVPVEGGEITVRMYEPSTPVTEPRPVYVNFHGGGYLYGGLFTDEDFCKRIVHELNIVVFDVDYRLSPEYTFPIPTADCWAGFSWVRSKASEFNLDLNRIAVGGNSAGGNAATLVAHRCRDNGIPLAFQFLAVPVCDMDVFAPNGEVSPDCPYASYHEFKDVVLLPAQSMSAFTDYYLSGDIGKPRPAELYNNPAVSPIKAKSLAGLAPAFIFTAELDVLRDEGERYGELLKEAGVKVEMIRVPGIGHIFTHLDAILEQAKMANREALRAIGQGLGVRA